MSYKLHKKAVKVYIILFRLVLVIAYYVVLGAVWNSIESGFNFNFQLSGITISVLCLVAYQILGD